MNSTGSMTFVCASFSAPTHSVFRVPLLRLALATLFAAFVAAGGSHARALNALVINEIYYDPPEKTKQSRFIELYNVEAMHRRTFQNWHLAEGVQFSFPREHPSRRMAFSSSRKIRRSSQQNSDPLPSARIPAVSTGEGRRSSFATLTMRSSIMSITASVFPGPPPPAAPVRRWNSSILSCRATIPLPGAARVIRYSGVIRNPANPSPTRTKSVRRPARRTPPSPSICRQSSIKLRTFRSAACGTSAHDWSAGSRECGHP